MLSVAKTFPPANESVFRQSLSAMIQLRNRHLLILDLVVLSLLPAAALLIRLEEFGKIFPYLNALVVFSLVSLALRLIVFLPSGLYNRHWRYATVDEMSRIVRAVAASSAVIAVLFYYCNGLRHGSPDLFLPRSLPIIDALLTLIAIGSSRFGIRMAQHLNYRRPGPDARRVLIVGAGNAGQRLVKDIVANPQLGIQPVGFIDDDPHLHGLKILNLPVLGNRTRLGMLVKAQRADQVIIAIPSAPGKEIRAYMDLCAASNIPAKTVPSVSAILENRVSISEVREVALEDLLRRAPVETDIAAVLKLIRGKRVLITGGGGSIGSELCRQALLCSPSDLALLGHGENSIFESHNQLLQTQRGLKFEMNGVELPHPTRIHPIIADIRSPRRIQDVITEFRPDIIFHAAAHKHVPLMEANPTEAIANNVLGTQNLLQAALDHDVQHFVMISTDKAVNPTSVMGASKRAAELFVLKAARDSGRPFVVVRFGNVLGSRGSVVPTFKRQIAKGGPITISDPEMTRYFMTIPEAVQLVLQAAVLGRGARSICWIWARRSRSSIWQKI